MKKMIIAVAATVACFAASAQTANFDGFSGALNLNLVGASTKLELDVGGPELDGAGKNSTAFGVQAAYGLALSNDFVVNIGGTYALSSPSILSIKNGNDTITGKAENMLSLYVEPGFLISDKTLFYGKLSYESTKAILTPSEGDSVSKSITGMGYGAGIRTMLNKNTFLQVELKQINYGAAKFAADQTEFKSSATLGSVGIGFKF
jgi:opacity protein-like surface antigen